MRSSRDWASKHNPLYAGPHADLLAMLPFLALTLLLYLAGRSAATKAS